MESSLTLTEFLLAYVNQKPLDPEFKKCLLASTIDQLKHEEKLIEQEILKVKQVHSTTEIQSKQKYASLCSAHTDLFAPNALIEKL